jgi:hypothetical protein
MRDDSARRLPLVGAAVLIAAMIAVAPAPGSGAGETTDNPAGRSTLATAGTSPLPPAIGPAATPLCVLPASNVRHAGDGEAIDFHTQRCHERYSSGAMFDRPRITEC